MNRSGEVQQGGEDQVQRLSAELGELRGVVRGVDGKVDDLRAGMAKLTEAMTQVVRLEVKHDQVATSTAALRDRQDLLDRRIDAVERDMPQLLEARQWIVRAMIAVVGFVGMAAIALVIVKH